MNLRLNAHIGLLILSLTVTSLAQEEEGAVQKKAVADAPADVAVANEDAGIQFYESQLNRLVKQETTRLKQAASLTDKQADELGQGLKDLIAKLAKQNAKVSKGPNGQIRYINISNLPKMLSDALLSAAEKMTSKEKIQAFRADAKIRQGFRKRIAKASVLIALDRQLATTAKQQATLADIIDENWQERWEFDAANMVFSQGLGQLASLPDAELKAVLTPLQYKVWSKTKGEFRTGVAIGPFAGSDDDKRMEAELAKFKEACLTAVQLKVEEFDLAYGGLNASQNKKFQVIGKGAVEQVVALRKKAMVEMRTFTPANGGMPNLRNMEVLMSTPSMLLDARSRWPLFAGKVLDEKQRDQHKERQAKRRQLGHEALMGSLVSSMDRQMGFSGKQYAAFENLLIESVPPSKSGTTMPYDVFPHLIAIPEEKYRTVLNDKQWAEYSNQMAMVRQQLDAMKKAEEKKE